MYLYNLVQWFKKRSDFIESMTTIDRVYNNFLMSWKCSQGFLSWTDIISWQAERIHLNIKCWKEFLLETISQAINKTFVN